MNTASQNLNGAADIKRGRRSVSASDPIKLDRLPPHELSAERAVVGCCLISPNSCIDACIERLRFGGEELYDLRNREIYQTLVAMKNLMVPIDLISVQSWLKDSGMLEQVGGVAELSNMQDEVPSAANLDYWLTIVLEKFLLRQMIQTCTNVVGRVYDYQGEVDLLLDEVERDILAIRPSKLLGERDIKQLANDAIGKIETLFNSRGAITGLSTGLADLDYKTDGMHNGEMIIVAAYPSCGKSALAAGIAIHNALNKIPVTVFSLEMQPAQIVVRAISSESQVNLYDIRRGIANEGDFQKMTSAVTRISASPLYVENANGMTIAQLQAASRRLKQKHDIKLIVVDYLQLLTCPGKDSREQEVSAISKGIKAIAMELNIPVLALSQLNDDGKLRESRAIGQDADGVWKIEPQGEKQEKIQPVRIIIEKNKEGEVGFVELVFQKSYTKFVSASKISDADVPTND